MASCSRCGTGRGTGSTGCECAIVGSDCIEVTGIGTQQSPFVVSPVVAACPDNLLECVPAGGTSADGQCDGPGLYVGQADPCEMIAGGADCDDNILECRDGTDGCTPGLYVPPHTGELTHEDTPTVELQGLGTPASPLTATVHPGCGLRVKDANDPEVGPGLEVATSADDHLDAAQQAFGIIFQPNTDTSQLLDDCVDDNQMGAAIWCDDNGELRTMPLGAVRTERLGRGDTGGVSNGGSAQGFNLCDLAGTGAPPTRVDTLRPDEDGAPVGTPDGTAPFTTFRFWEFEYEVDALVLRNPSDCYPMSVQIDARGRSRLDTIHPYYWPERDTRDANGDGVPDTIGPPNNWAYAGQLRMGIRVRGALRGDGDYVIQRSQYNIDTTVNNLAVNDSRESQQWTDFDSPPVIIVAPGGVARIDRWVDFQDQAQDDPVRDGDGRFQRGTGLCREVRYNAPGLTALGVALPLM